MNITNRAPFQKAPKAKPDPTYLAAVRQLPCCICDGWGMVQLSPTTAHHPIMGRYSARKVPDRQAIPLCDGHHQGTFDTSKIAVHREPQAWAEAYGVDGDFTAVTQDNVDRMGGAA